MCTHDELKYELEKSIQNRKRIKSEELLLYYKLRKISLDLSKTNNILREIGGIR